MLEGFFIDNNITVEYVPPGDHRTNPAERAIRTGKNHLISSIATCHITFPPDLWHLLLPTLELTLNSMRWWTPDPTKSARTALPSISMPTPYTLSASSVWPMSRRRRVNHGINTASGHTGWDPPLTITGVHGSSSAPPNPPAIPTPWTTTPTPSFIGPFPRPLLPSPRLTPSVLTPLLMARTSWSHLC
jgi:hypothetical protein